MKDRTHHTRNKMSIGVQVFHVCVCGKEYVEEKSYIRREHAIIYEEGTPL